MKKTLARILFLLAVAMTVTLVPGLDCNFGGSGEIEPDNDD